MGVLFGTDGVRGVANFELTPELAFELGRAGAYVLTKENQKENKKAPQILLGMDTRISGDMLEAALTAGICSVGASVHTAGVIPSPAAAYLVRKYGLDAGVVISASHNPFADNGIKFFTRDGYKLPDSLEDEIEDIMLRRKDSVPRPAGAEVGRRKTASRALDDYLDFLVSTVESQPGHKPFESLKIALDCANGATYRAAPAVFSRLGAEVSVIHDEPDGVNINDNCGSTHLESLSDFVKEKGAHIGFAFDGDGDRCLIVDENGKAVEGDEILSICGNMMKDTGKLRHNTIVATVMSNLGLSIMGGEKEICIERTAVGDRYVLERMLEGNFNLGGEQSGHIILLDYNTTGDGILTALQMVDILRKSGKAFSELNRYMEVLPQCLLKAHVPNDMKQRYMEVDEIRNAIADLEKKFSGEGRVLIRPSGTEPAVRVLIEGRDKKIIEYEAGRLVQMIEDCFRS